MRRTVTACVCIAWMAAVCVEARGPFRRARRRPRRRRTPAQSPAPATPARELVAKYCVTCHNERLKTGGPARSTRLTPIRWSNSADTWEKVVVKLRSRAMPPAGHAAPGQRHLRRRRRVARDGAGPRGSWPVRIRAGRRISIGSIAPNTPTRFATCLASRSIGASMLPPDAQAHGFDTNADALGDRAGAARSLSDRGREDRAPRRRRPDAAARRSSATPPSKATRTSRPGSGRPSVSAKTSAGLARRHRGAPLLPGGWRIRHQGPAAAGPTPDVIRGLNDAERRSRFASMASASGSSRSAAPTSPRSPARRRRRDAAGARAAEGRPPPGGRDHRQVRATSRPKGWARSAFRSGTAKATCPSVPTRPSRRC